MALAVITVTIPAVTPPLYHHTILVIMAVVSTLVTHAGDTTQAAKFQP